MKPNSWVFRMSLSHDPDRIPLMLSGLRVLDFSQYLAGPFVKDGRSG